MSPLTGWEQARLRFYQARVRHLIQRERWTEGLTALIDLAGWMTGRTEDRALWLELMITATEIAGHLADPAEYRAFLAHFGEPFLSKAKAPSALLEAFTSIADTADPQVMRAVGRWLTDARQAWPLGPYLVAHFAGAGDEPAETAQAFAQAEERAARAGLSAWERLARLRRAASLLLSGADPARGRELLHSLDWSALPPAQQLWMAVALSASAHWADRLRAMDIILDLHQALEAARPLPGELNVDDLKEAASAIFQLASLHLPEAEERRLQELLNTLFQGPERETWTSYLQARRELSRICALPFQQAQDARSLLQKLAALNPGRWRPTAQHFEILQAGATGTYKGSTSTPAPLDDVRLAVADAAAALLQHLHDGANLESALKRLNQALAALDPTQDGPMAQPISLVWSALLKARHQQDLPTLEPLLAELARHHTKLARPPSFGWWLLSAHLFQAELPKPASIVAERALTSSEPGLHSPQKAYVANRILRRAIAQKDLPRTRRWLPEISAGS